MSCAGVNQGDSSSWMNIAIIATATIAVISLVATSILGTLSSCHVPFASNLPLQVIMPAGLSAGLFFGIVSYALKSCVRTTERDHTPPNQQTAPKEFKYEQPTKTEHKDEPTQPVNPNQGKSYLNPDDNEAPGAPSSSHGKKTPWSILHGERKSVI